MAPKITEPFFPGLWVFGPVCKHVCEFGEIQDGKKQMENKVILYAIWKWILILFKIKMEKMISYSEKNRRKDIKMVSMLLIPVTVCGNKQPSAQGELVAREQLW